MSLPVNPERPLCVVCGSTRGQISSFTDETLAEYRELLNLRKKYGLNYTDFLLPSNASELHGYHPMCYKYFAKVNAKYFAEESSLSTSTTSASPHSSTNTKDKTMEVDETEYVQSKFNEVMLAEVETRDGEQEFSRIESADAHCFFCYYMYGMEKSSNEKDGTLLKMDKQSIESFRSYAERVEMYGVFSQIGACLKKRGQIYYHAKCESDFYEKNLAHGSDNRDDVYKKLYAYVEDRVVKNRQCTLLSSLQNFYDYHLNNNYKYYSKCNKDFFTQHGIEEKLLGEKLFKKKLSIVVKNDQKVVVRKGIAVTDSILKELERAAIVEEAALILRDEILEIEPSKLPKRDVSFQEIVKGECEIPEELENFYETLLSGENHRLEASARCKTLSQSFSQDAIYAVTKGKIKTSKHIILANCLKAATNTMTRSKSVVRITNRLGHCCSYEASQFYDTVPEHPGDGSEYDLDDHYEDFSDHGSYYAKNNGDSESSDDDV